ncbi:uncharacterized protein LOC113272653 [Papaver somniferum]|uniref:uncharacterized protein LOC113272653 n=1 Tax=Papaver somniferum TaxID=3469 RepID=UPI000E6F4DED|nr:uncharacterized protein LOC113272653 [Papaver somniferum]
MCGEESTTHMLIQCTFARSVWNAISQDIAQEISSVQDIQHWIKTWSNTYSSINFKKQETINLIVIALWFIWKAICELVFDNKRSSTNSLNTELEISARTEGSGTNINRWNPPQRGWLKINIDASVPPGSNIAGIALIIRYFAGQLVEAWTMIERVRDVTQAEVVAALKALRWIYQLQLQNVT